jgi:hypothetical protein
MRTIALSLAGLLLSIPAVQAAPTLSLVATYDTGLGANGAEIIDVRTLDNLAVLTNVGGGTPAGSSVDVLNLSNLNAPVRLRRVNLQDQTRTLNSVAIHPSKDFFLIVQGNSSPAAAPVFGTISAYRISDGAFLCSATVGLQPDSVDISPDGNTAVVANEAEGFAQGDNGGPGSLTRVDLNSFTPVPGCTLPVTQIALPSAAGTPGFSTNRTDDAGRLAIDNTPGTLEPESVTFSPDNQFAFLTLQENNGVVRLELATNGLTYFGLGRVNHLADVSTSGGYQPVTPYTEFREPDGIALTPDGQYFVTANEGDTRDGAGASGIRGGRTVSIFDAQTGTLVGDTGSQLDDIAAARGVYPDSRSNRGGSEPEVLDVIGYAGKVFAAVSLERANGVALIDITNPATPQVVDLGLSGMAPEGIKFFPRKSRLYVLSANEVSGTVSIFQVIP